MVTTYRGNRAKFMSMHLMNRCLNVRLSHRHSSQGIYFMGMHLMGIYFMGMHLMGVHLIGVYLTDVYLMACTS
jgi:hypothetical protein